MRYEPILESLKQHEVPAWYHDAKLGIFIHWGLPSVPAWAPLTGELTEVAETIGWEALFGQNPYSEWYLNSLRIEGSPTYRHHLETYGPDFPYDDFVPQFNEAIRRWDPGAWASFFRQIGARYVVLVTKHHDGFLLWPSERTSPYKKDYKTSRDIAGELASAVRAQGMRMGFYYSGGLDWSFNPKPIKTRDDVYSTIVQTPEFIEYVDYHWRELIDRYQTAILWNDIGYPTNAPVLDLFAHYYNTIPDGVINDRFGQVTSASGLADEGVLENPGGVHYDFTTPEYSSYDRIMAHKWEATRGIGFSFGYNRAEGPDSYLSAEEVIRLFVDIVSKNGNLLLNVGPMSNGTIPELQRACLEGLGAWLTVNGEAIYGTRPWLTAEGRTADGTGIRYTQKGDALYVVLLDAPKANPVALPALRAPKDATIQLLGHEAPLTWRQDGERLTVVLPQGMAEAPAYTLRIAPQPLLLAPGQ
jgi:alpha-L-fucosidase